MCRVEQRRADAGRRPKPLLHLLGQDHDRLRVDLPRPLAAAGFDRDGEDPALAALRRELRRGG